VDFIALILMVVVLVLVVWQFSDERKR